MTTQGYREANYKGLQCPVDQCQILGQNGVQHLSENPFFKADLHRRSVTPSKPSTKGHKKVSKEDERPKRRCHSQPQRTLTQAKKKNKGTRGHFPTLRQKNKNPKTKTQAKTKRGRNAPRAPSIPSKKCCDYK